MILTRRNNKGLSKDRLTRTSNTKVKYPRVSYSDEDRQIIGECCINGKDYRDAKYILMSTGKKGTRLNKGTWDILNNRVRGEYGGLDGVKHWMRFNKDLGFYIHDFQGVREQLRKELQEN